MKIDQVMSQALLWSVEEIDAIPAVLEQLWRTEEAFLIVQLTHKTVLMQPLTFDVLQSS